MKVLRVPENFSEVLVNSIYFFLSSFSIQMINAFLIT